jgi:hypothetical protein
MENALNEKTNRIIISTLEEQEDSMRAYWASISPIERLIHLHEMIVQTYDLKNYKPVFSNRINCKYL